MERRHIIEVLELVICDSLLSHQTKDKKKLKEWQNKVAEMAKQNYSHPVDSESSFVVELSYYFKSKSPDIDNFHKPIQDALQGIVYTNDSQVNLGKTRKEKMERNYIIDPSTYNLLEAFKNKPDNIVHLIIKKEMWS